MPADRLQRQGRAPKRHRAAGGLQRQRTATVAKDTTRYTDEEAQRRFEKLVRTALNTPPKPMKKMPRKRPAAKLKPGKVTKR